MASETEAGSSVKEGSTIVIAIVAPSVFLIVLIVLIITAFVLPRIGHGSNDFAAIKDQRMKQRLEDINNIIKTQNYYEWLAAQKERDSKCLLQTDPLCTICLDDFVDDAQIRGLRCRHAFHTHCLDEWFARFNEHCPLCHQTIIPGRKVPRRKFSETPDPIPVAFIV